MNRHFQSKLSKNLCRFSSLIGWSQCYDTVGDKYGTQIAKKLLQLSQRFSFTGHSLVGTNSEKKQSLKTEI